MNILRSISFALTAVLYPLIPKLYEIFIYLGEFSLFSAKQIQELSTNVYILVSVCMLFAFGIKLLNTIVNPDIMDDKAKGTSRTFINAIIAVIMITITPMAFRILYDAQHRIIKEQLIEKIVFGMDTDADYKPGQVLAGYAFNAFCYPKGTQTTSIAIASEGENYYNRAITENIDYVDKIGDGINNKINDEYEMEYHILLSPLAGGYIVYELILMCIDIAFRTIKLGLLQLIAPLVICSFIFAGKDMLSRWLKEVVSTFILIFVKIAALTFMIYGLSQIPDLLDSIGADNSGFTGLAKGFIRVAILIGLLQLVKKLPEIINKIFGTNIENKEGGISGRLGEMAGVGGIAKNAWDFLRHHPVQAVGRPLGSAMALGSNVANRVAAGARESWANSPHSTPFVRVLRAGLRGAATGATGVLSAPGSIRRGWRNGFTALGRENQYYRDTHPENSTFPGRLAAGAARTFGLRTPYERSLRHDDEVVYNGQTMTVDQLKELQKPSTDFNSKVKTVKDLINAQIERSGSGIAFGPLTATFGGDTFTLGGGEYSAMLDKLRDFESQSYTDLGLSSAQNKAEILANLKAQLEAAKRNEADAIEQDIWSTGNAAAGGHLTGQRLADARTAMTEATAIVNNNAEFRANFHDAAGHSYVRTNAATGMVFFDATMIGGRIMDTAVGHSAAAQIDQVVTGINTALINHEAEVTARHTSPQARQDQANQSAADAARNNNGGGSGGGGNS